MLLLSIVKNKKSGIKITAFRCIIYFGGVIHDFSYQAVEAGAENITDATCVCHQFQSGFNHGLGTWKEGAKAGDAHRYGGFL